MVGIATTLAFFAPAGYWDSMQSIITNPKADYNWDAGQGRRKLAERGIGYMLDYPVFGIGLDNFGMAEGLYSDYAKEMQALDIGVKWSAPHNSWVEAGAETGITGLVVWGALVFGSVGGLLKLRRRRPVDGLRWHRRPEVHVPGDPLRARRNPRVCGLRDVRVVCLERPILRAPGDRHGHPTGVRE